LTEPKKGERFSQWQNEWDSSSRFYRSSEWQMRKRVTTLELLLNS